MMTTAAAARRGAALLRRPLPPWTTTPARRAYATASAKQPSTTSRFYKTFGRPVAKALLLAVFAYQVVYWAWARLEADEARAERQATVAALEAEIRARTADARPGSGARGKAGG